MSPGRAGNGMGGGDLDSATTGGEGRMRSERWNRTRVLKVVAGAMTIVGTCGRPAPAIAGDIFVGVSDGFHFGDYDAHGWIRTFPDEQGWFFLHAAGGDYLLNHLDESFQVENPDQDPTLLTGHTDLIDHGIARCPDGGYLHVSFSHATTDTQYSFRYDADWNLLGEHVLAENDPFVHASDPPVLCSSLLNATGHGYGNGSAFRMVVLDDNGAKVRTKDLEDPVPSTGSAMMADYDTSTIIIVGFPWGFDYGLAMRRYDTDLELVESRSLHIPVPDDRRPMWSQGFMKVGDHYIVAYVVTTEQGGTSSDTGDIWLSAFDADWEHVETVAVVEEKDDYWAYMRPGLSRKGNALVVSFDHQEGPLLAVVTLDLEALGEDPATWTPWPDDDDSTQDGDDDSPAESTGEEETTGCSCASSSSGTGTPLLLLLPLALLRNRSSQRSNRDPNRTHTGDDHAIAPSTCTTLT